MEETALSPWNLVPLNASVALQQVLLHGVAIQRFNSETRTVGPCCAYLTLVPMVMGRKPAFVLLLAYLEKHVQGPSLLWYLLRIKKYILRCFPYLAGDMNLFISRSRPRYIILEIHYCLIVA